MFRCNATKNYNKKIIEQRLNRDAYTKPGLSSLAAKFEALFFQNTEIPQEKKKSGQIGTLL